MQIKDRSNRMCITQACVLQGDVGGNLRGNLYCLYCHTPAMQPILFMEKQELKEVRHMVHACGPISASFKSLKQVSPNCCDLAECVK